jgi:transcriptional regulator with XRE-family HTH domain
LPAIADSYQPTSGLDITQGLDKRLEVCKNISMQQLNGGTQTLLYKLKAIQLRERLSDREMAQRLNCTRQHYQATRTGDTPLGKKVLAGISAAFPELQQDVIYFLSNDDDKSAKDATKKRFNQPSEPQERGLRGFCMELLGRLAKSLKA